jgi:hypothetical protein
MIFELLPQALVLLARVNLICVAPQIEVVADDQLPWPAAYVRTIENVNLVKIRQSEAESPAAYRVLVHELIHCGLYERREQTHRRHPHPLDPKEELIVQAMTDKLLRD